MSSFNAKSLLGCLANETTSEIWEKTKTNKLIGFKYEIFLTFFFKKFVGLGMQLT